jgi:hypothetical protein
MGSSGLAIGGGERVAFLFDGDEGTRISKQKKNPTYYTHIKTKSTKKNLIFQLFLLPPIHIN